MHGRRWSDTINKMFDYLNYYTIALAGGLAEALILMFMTTVAILAHIAAALMCKAEARVRHLEQHIPLIKEKMRRMREGIEE